MRHKGSKLSEEHKRKIAIAHTGKHGEAASNWRGGILIHTDGYRMVKSYDHPFKDIKKYVMEHRLIWEKYNNAILLPWSDVHHINGNVIDNRIENLEAMTHSQHMRLENLQ